MSDDNIIVDSWVRQLQIAKYGRKAVGYIGREPAAKCLAAILLTLMFQVTVLALLAGWIIQGARLTGLM